MSAGTGVFHSEQNASSQLPVHFLQIWLLPDRPGHAPGYEQKAFPRAERQGRLRLIASPDGADGSVSVHQDVRLYVTNLAEREKAELPLAQGRHAWVQVARGTVKLGDQELSAGDGAALSEEAAVVLSGTAEPSEVLVFDLA
jgi:redox-sensitive bicupin YhaK (pirin superfamily)